MVIEFFLQWLICIEFVLNSDCFYQTSRKNLKDRVVAPWSKWSL